jgi:hypothetical protein
MVEAILEKRYEVAPVNQPEEFVLCCAVAACGKHILNGNDYLIERFRNYASDERWRIRESVAMGLQHIGKFSFEKLRSIVGSWIGGNYYEQRAVVAGLCEPAILKGDEIKEYTVSTLGEITRKLLSAKDRSLPEYKTLVQALCYCWSVAIVAFPERGKTLFEEFIPAKEKDLKKILNENFKKNRLLKMDKPWVESIVKQINS